jgi:hypothetical protein
MNLRQAIRTHPADWTAANLAELRAEELADLCRLMGIPHSGTKPTKIARLLNAADLRTILASYNHPDQMTPYFSRKSLVGLAKRAGVYPGGNKYGLAAGLINWRNECRRIGQAYLEETRAAAAERPRQHRLDLEPRG